MANEAGQGCQVLASDIPNYSMIDFGNKAIAGTVTAMRYHKEITAGFGDFRFAFGTMATDTWTSTSGTKGPFTNSTPNDCYVATGGGVDFTNFSVDADDYMMAWDDASGDQMYSLSGGPGHWRKQGDFTADLSEAMTWDADADTAFGADITVAGGLSIPIAMHHYQQQQRGFSCG